MHQQLTAFEHIVGKEVIALNEQFLLFPQCLLLHRTIVSPFVHIFDIISLFPAESEEPRIGVRGKGFKGYIASLVIFRFCARNQITIVEIFSN